MTAIEASGAGLAAGASSGLDLGALRVLFLDDDQFIRFTLKRVLRSLGVSDFREAADGDSALRLLEDAFTPDIILCDVKMAPMDGPTFLRRLRASPRPGNATVPIIMLTGVADDEIMQETAGLGVTDYLQKPVTAAQLAESLGRTFKAGNSARP